MPRLLALAVPESKGIRGRIILSSAIKIKWMDKSHLGAFFVRRNPKVAFANCAVKKGEGGSLKKLYYLLTFMSCAVNIVEK